MHLRSLDLSHCYNVLASSNDVDGGGRNEDIYLGLIFNRFSCLSSLSLAGLVELTDSMVTSLCVSIASLTAIDINGCSKLTDTSLISISNYIGKRLVTLNISHNNNYTNKGNYTL